MGFRFIFQSNMKTLTIDEIDRVLNDIIESTLKIKSIKIPGIEK